MVHEESRETVAANADGRIVLEKVNDVVYRCLKTFRIQSCMGTVRSKPTLPPRKVAYSPATQPRASTVTWKTAGVAFKHRRLGEDRWEDAHQTYLLFPLHEN